MARRPLAALAAWVLAALLAACTPAPPGAPTAIARAQAVLRPDGGPVQSKTVALQHRWDREFPGRGGSATYTIELPPAPDGVPQALLFSHLGNQAAVRLNGVLVQQFGILGDPSTDAGHTSLHVVLPPALLRSDAPNVVTIDATMQPLRHGGLWQLRAGPEALIAPLAQRQRLLDEYASAAYAASLLLVGGLAAALWWRQRDAVYGCFALAALLGALRQLDPLMTPSPLPWPWWGWLLAVSYAAQLLLTARFIFLVLDRDPPWLRRTTYGVLAAVVLLPTLSFALGRPLLWTAGLGLLLVYGIGAFGIVLHEAWTKRRPLAWLVFAAGCVLLAAGGHDFAFVRIGASAASAPELAPHALFLFVLILAGLFVARYSRSVADYRALNHTLEQRIAERERQLGEAFEALRAQREQQAVSNERQRIMREIHDGIGSQLVGLLGMVGRHDAAPAALEEQVRGALDEMRMAVDSLQPVHGDLTTVLATLRYRLQPRLQAAGIEVVWDVDALPALPALAPQSVLHLQRILLEAITNVLKHAQATRVTVQARWRDGDPPAVLLRLLDDGVGLADAAAPARGHGLGNMAARAQAIGAALRFEPAPGGGTAVAIDWPMAGDVSTSSARP